MVSAKGPSSGANSGANTDGSVVDAVVAIDNRGASVGQFESVGGEDKVLVVV